MKWTLGVTKQRRSGHNTNEKLPLFVSLAWWKTVLAFSVIYSLLKDLKNVLEELLYAYPKEFIVVY